MIAAIILCAVAGLAIAGLASWRRADREQDDFWSSFDD